MIRKCLRAGSANVFNTWSLLAVFGLAIATSYGPGTPGAWAGLAVLFLSAVGLVASLCMLSFSAIDRRAAKGRQQGPWRWDDEVGQWVPSLTDEP